MTRLSTAGSAAPVGGTRKAPDRHGTAVLLSKLMPPDQVHATVARPRLLSLLTREVQRSPLTLLSGPAGSGKTALASSWQQSQRAGWSTAWLSLDDYDDDPATFWGYLIEALSGAGVELSEDPVLVPGEAPPGWLVPRLAADVHASSRPVVLVIDKADHITDRSIVTGLDLLIGHAGSRLRLVLCARADPLLPLHRYRLAGTLSEIRGDQLNFTSDETRELLATMGLQVTAQAAAALCSETQG